MNTVSDTPVGAKTTTTPPKGNGVVRWFSNNPISEGAGDAALSPPVTCGHTPDATLGAVLVPAGAPEGGRVSNPPKHDPLADPGVIAIPLPESISATLRDCGPALVVIGAGTYPNHPGKLLLYAYPCSIQAANNATRVARGECRAAKIRKI